MEVFDHTPHYGDIPSLTSEVTYTTEESFEMDDWSSLSPTLAEQNAYHPQHPHHTHHPHQQQQQQYHQQQAYHHPPYHHYHHQTYPPSQYHGYQYQHQTSPYASYYMPSPPVEYQHGYVGQQYHYEPSPLPLPLKTPLCLPSPGVDGNSCEVCARTFKSVANLSRHMQSKTHLKRVNSRRPTVARTKKPKLLGSVLTDLSDEEKRFLWRLDDDIYLFLRERERERICAKEGKGEILPTPPLSPTRRKIMSMTAAVEEEEEEDVELQEETEEESDERLFNEIIEEETFECVVRCNSDDDLSSFDGGRTMALVTES